jgi:hypothetical protein
MADKARDRLAKKRDELREAQEVSRHLFRFMGFHILSAAPPAAQPREVWLHVSEVAYATQETIRVAERWIDPFPDGSQCLWWWGDTKAVGAFCKWGDETAVALCEYRDSLPDLSDCTDMGYYGTLRILCELALIDKDGNLVTQRALDFSPPLRRHRLMPAFMNECQPAITFSILETCDEGSIFCLKVLNHLLDDVPRLVVDLPSRCVHWKGTTYPLDEAQINIVNLLLANRGKGPLSEKMMKDSCVMLNGVHFNRAMRERLPKPLQDLVKSAKGKGWWLELPST